MTRMFDGLNVPFKSYEEVQQHLYDFKKVLPRGHRWMMPGVVTVRMRHQQNTSGICFALSQSWMKQHLVVSIMLQLDVGVLCQLVLF